MTKTLIGLLLAASAAVADEDPIRFDRDIKPILSNHCYPCHGPSESDREAKLRLDVQKEALAARKKGPAVKPGDLAGSGVWKRITHADADERMPPPDAKKPLNARQIELIRRWIKAGAEWSQHWSFVAPKKRAEPRVSDSKWTRNAIDRFILARLEKEGIKPSAEADRRTLIRRLSLDLIGLPPKPAEVEAFVNDRSPKALETLVDRLLASRHYGERMALLWLDAARYGDTSVHHADGPRDMWAWRDRVVKAYNDNLPFDRFSIEQLAGDLIPEATLEQQILSGFNRNNATTDEGGAIAEEYRIKYAVDRVKTTSTIWLGLSMECGQCHEHKYDPVSQEEYYQFFAFFNVSSDKGMQSRKGNAQPMISIPDPAAERELPAIKAKIAAVDAKMKARRAAIGPAFDTWVKKKEAEAKDPSRPAVQMPGAALLDFAIDEGKGGSIKDGIDPKRVGRIKGKAQWTKGRSDHALKFNGKNYVDLGNVADFERTDRFSYGGWVQVEPNTTGAILARMDDRSSYRGYDLYVSKGRVSAHLINAWPGNAIKVTTKKAIKARTWHHVMMTYDGSSKAKGVTIYVNGEPWPWAIEQNGLRATMRTPKTLLIGSRHPGSRFRGMIDAIQVYDRMLGAEEVKALAKGDTLTPVLAIPAAKRTKAQVESLRKYYLNRVDGPYKALAKERNALSAREGELNKPVTTVMVMKDMAKPRDTFILNRGAYDAPTKKKVTAGTPAILPPMAQGDPRNRLGLARWLFRPDHPLTARVTVNRTWQTFFGTGLVATSSDFGSQGTYPSHPELLDWLAVDFRESGWDVKRMIKQIVLSATYRQSSKVSPELLRRDPENRLLGRGPRFRLQGELIRDAALAVSGLLITDFGGPGVKPYQPPGLWKEVGLGGNPKFVQDKGRKLYRRSLYTYWKRSAPPPNMKIFDAPTREECVVQRPRTNTPLQALVTLNDVQFVEAARHLAERMMKEGGAGAKKRAEFGFLLATARRPRPSERAVLIDVYRHGLKRYRGDGEAAKKLLASGESKRDASLDAAEQAAWTVVASMILNLDETLTRE